MFLSLELSHWLFSQERDICSFPHFSPCCVWVAVYLHWTGTESEAKWNDAELAQSCSVRAMACKEVGSWCNMPQELELVVW